MRFIQVISTSCLLGLVLSAPAPAANRVLIDQPVSPPSWALMEPAKPMLNSALREVISIDEKPGFLVIN